MNLKSLLAQAVFALSCLAHPSFAQTATTTLVLPAQLQSAKTAYLAAAGASTLGPVKLDIATHIYEQISAGVLKSYALKSSPAEAELSIRMSVEASFGEVDSGRNQIFYYLRLSVFDTKTGALLWVLDEPVQRANRESTAIKNFEASAIKLGVDLQSLAAGHLPNNGLNPVPNSTEEKH